MDGCIELTGGVPEKVKNLHDLLKPEDNGKTADRLFFDLVRASQLGNIILVQAPHHVHKGDKHNKLRLAEAAQLGLEVKYVYRVTQVANLGEGRQIIRVKNCSGPKGINWIGAWHPEDTRWANVGDSIRRELDAGNAPKIIICILHPRILGWRISSTYLCMYLHLIKFLYISTETFHDGGFWMAYG